MCNKEIEKLIQIMSATRNSEESQTADQIKAKYREAVIRESLKKDAKDKGIPLSPQELDKFTNDILKS